MYPFVYQRTGDNTTHFSNEHIEAGFEWKIWETHKCNLLLFSRYAHAHIPLLVMSKQENKVRFHVLRLSQFNTFLLLMHFFILFFLLVVAFNFL